MLLNLEFWFREAILQIEKEFPQALAFIGIAYILPETNRYYAYGQSINNAEILPRSFGNVFEQCEICLGKPEFIHNDYCIGTHIPELNFSFATAVATPDPLILVFLERFVEIFAHLIVEGTTRIEAYDFDPD